MKFREIPVSLQHTVLSRLGTGAVSLVAGIGILVLTRNPVLVLPFVLATLLPVLAACRIYRMAMQGRCIVLRGTVLNQEKTLLKRRPKSLLLEIEGKAVQLVLHNRLRAPKAGATVELQIPDDAMLYEWKGMHRLETYFALAEVPADSQVSK